MTLTEFLLARIAEDEAVARDVAGERIRVGELIDYPAEGEDRTFWADYDGGWPSVSVGAHRVLAECGAKRRRVDLFARWDALCPPGEWPEGDMGGAPLSDAGRYLLRLEAMPYADHPDYDESWRP